MSARLESSELNALRWLLGQILVILTLVGTYAIDLGSGILVTGALLLVGIVTLRPRLATLLPGFFQRYVPWILLLWIAADFLASGGDILPPLFRMVVLLAVFRSIRLRTCREDLQLLLLTLFILLLTGVMSLEITFGLQLMAFAPLAMGLLFVVNLCRPIDVSPEAEAAASALPPDGWRPLMGRVRERMDRATLVAGVGLFAITSGLTLLLFVALPRFDIGAALPFPRLQTSNSLTGFTDHVRYGDVTRILNDDAIAMRVDVRMDQPPARPYWRMVVLDAYYDGGFRVSEQVASTYRRRNHYRFAFDRPAWEEALNRDSEWTVYLEGGVSAYLPTGDSFDSLRFQNRSDLQIHTLTRVLKTPEVNASTLSLRYRGLGFGGRLPIAAEDRMLPALEPFATETDEPDSMVGIAYPRTLLAYPQGAANRRILDEVLDAIGPVDGLPAREFSTRLSRHLQAGRGYSLESRVPPGEADTLLRWVDSDRPGHCELYAGAFVLIARYAGYPARLVTGFAGGDWNGFENYFMVRNRHAHAWCEVFDPAIGWFRVDPTPGYERDPGSVDDALAGGGMRLDRTWQAYVDSLRILWFRRVIQFDSEEQEQIAGAIRTAGSLGRDWLSERLRGIADGWRESWQGFLEGRDRLGLPVRLLPLLAIPLLIWAWIRLRRHWRGRPGWEARIRRRAGSLLRRCAEPSGALDAERALLERLRYASPESWPPEPESRLKELARAIRRGHPVKDR
jgi:transglutaminase-like putative cysteine protease